MTSLRPSFTFFHPHSSKWHAVLLSLLLLSPFSWAQFVHTKGTKIVDPQGKEMYLNGINLGNWLLWEGYLMMGDFEYRTHSQFLESLAQTFGSMKKARKFEHEWRQHYVDESAIKDLKELGFNSVRLPFNHKLFWKDGKLRDHGFQYFDRLIKWCKKYDIYILLDMHAAPGYQNPGDHSDNVDSNKHQPRDSVKFWDGDNVDIAAKIWKHIAKRYKNEPIIWGYDLINEPVAQDGRGYEVLPSMIKMRNAIREVDNNHIIVAEGDWWGSNMHSLDWTNPDTQKATGVTERWDDNLVFETHHYVFGNKDNINDLYGRDDVTNALNVPLILGEYGEDTPEILRIMADWSQQNIAGAFPWSFKKMSHHRTLWTIPPNDLYKKVVAHINGTGPKPKNAYKGMMKFAKKNISNSSKGLQWDQSFYDAIKLK